MAKVRQILCIDPEPAELRIEALLNRQGIAATLTEASLPEALRVAIARPSLWDLILCNATSFLDLGIGDLLGAVRLDLDASLVLLRPQGQVLSPAEGHRWGAADVVRWGDVEHLLMVCEREIQNCAVRKELRSQRQAPGTYAHALQPPLLVATISDLGKAVRIASTERDQVNETLAVAEAPEKFQAEARIKSLIEAGGLTLEYQPIISFKAKEEHRGMFEVLIRLQDEFGRLLLPDEFLPVVAGAGWMGKVDLWIFRKALATLEQMQQGGYPDAVLFINVATQTLLSDSLVTAIGTFTAAARLSPGSIVVEVRKAAFEEASEGLRRLAGMLRTKHHGLLVEDVGLEDCAFLASHSSLITHLKIDRAIAVGLLDGCVPQLVLSEFVQCARREGMRVIALAVESADLLSMFFTAGVDAIQGHFVSLPYPDLMYPSIQRVEAISSPGWRMPGSPV